MVKEKLKALKDITFHGITNYTKYQEEKCKETIRDEAKKHLASYLEHKLCKHDNCYPGSECWECENQYIIEFIMGFFDIPKEEMESLR